VHLPCASSRALMPVCIIRESKQTFSTDDGASIDIDQVLRDRIWRSSIESFKETECDCITTTLEEHSSSMSRSSDLERHIMHARNVRRSVRRAQCTIIFISSVNRDNSLLVHSRSSRANSNHAIGVCYSAIRDLRPPASADKVSVSQPMCIAVAILRRA
jgi:hypothetical protein